MVLNQSCFPNSTAVHLRIEPKRSRSLSRFRKDHPPGLLVSRTHRRWHHRSYFVSTTHWLAD